MSVGSRMKERRESLGMTQVQLAESLGVSKGAVGNYETDANFPKVSILHKVFEVLKCDADFLFQDDLPERGENAASPWEMEHILKKYRVLDEHGKETVSLVLDCETRRMSSSRPEEKVVELFPFRRYIQSASAGLGDFSDDDSYEIIDLAKRPPAGASFLITVNGDSMEPTFHDNDLLFVRAQKTVNIGDIGLFVKGSHLYIKESGTNGLISHNKSGNYPPITPEEDMPILTEGKIVGVCTPDYLL